MKNIWILAQNDQGASTIEGIPMNSGQTQTNTQAPADPNLQGTKQTPKTGLVHYLPFILIFVVMYFLLFRGPKKKQQQHKKMVNSLQKNDRVRTIGGIIGTIVDVKDDEITLKVDESNNTKIKIIPSAIGNNISKDSA